MCKRLDAQEQTGFRNKTEEKEVAILRVLMSVSLYYYVSLLYGVFFSFDDYNIQIAWQKLQEDIKPKS